MKDNFVIKGGNYIAAVDFGSDQHNDISVEMILKYNQSKKIYEIESSKCLGKSKEFDKQKRENYINYISDLINSYSLRLKIGELQTLDDNDDRKVLDLLKEGDYIKCYNQNQGIIKEVKFPFFIIEFCNLEMEVHIMDIKQFTFN